MGINLRLRQIIMRAGDNSNEDWKNAAEKRVRYLASKQKPFTSEDVLGYLAVRGYKTHNNSALGSIMMRYSREGKIRKLGWKQADRRSRHGAPVRIWIGK